MTIETPVKPVPRKLSDQLSIREKLDLKSLLGSEHGRRVARLIVYRLCGIKNASFDPDRKYEVGLHTHVQEGRRSVGRDVEQILLELCPVEWHRGAEESAREWIEGLTLAASTGAPSGDFP